MKQPMCLAEHIAEFTGRKAKFREKKYLKDLRRKVRRKSAKREPDNKQTSQP